MPGGRIERMNLRLKTASITLAILAMGAASAQAAPSSKIKNLGETPGYMAADAQGNAWVAIGGMQDTVARVKPNGDVKKYEIPELDQAGGVALGPDNHIWFTVANEGVVELNPGNPENVTEHDIAEVGDARGITAGPQGKLWVSSDDQLIAFKPNNPAGYDFRTINGMGAREIASSGGKLFIADFAGGRVIKVTPDGNELDDATVKRYDVEGGPQGISGGPNGSAAYTNPGTDPQTVGRLSSDGHPKTSNAPMTDPFSIQFMSDGKFWFTEFAPDRMATLSQNGDVQNRNGLVPNNSGPRYSAKGKNGILFVGLEDIDKIAIIDVG